MGSKNSKKNNSTAASGAADGTAPVEDDGRKRHYILKSNLLFPPFPDHLEVMYFGAGCFWGTEKGFWRLPGVYSTAVGFQAGKRANPGYYDVCSGTTGHNEVTQVVFDPTKISVVDLLHRFWDAHDPTQGDGQGNDRGTQYRSGIYCTTEDQVAISRASRTATNKALKAIGYGKITTEVIGPGYYAEDRFNSCKGGKASYPEFYYAEDYHQQYLAIPGNRQYCSAEPTGVKVPDFMTYEGLDKEVMDRHMPFLPAGFWKTYVGSVRAPNSPAVWNDTAAAGADKAAEKIAKDFAKMQKKLEKNCQVIIRYCGGCGFQPKADELKAFLSEIIPAKKVGLLQDHGTTGNLDVSVKGSDGTWVMVHSKKGKDHGFVDSEAKKLRIVAAVNASTPVELNAIALSDIEGGDVKPVAASSGDELAKIESLIADNKVMIFSKSYCPFCKKAKQQFIDLGVEFTSIELDNEADGEAIQAALKGKTDIATVPVVYVNQKLVGDSGMTVAAREAGEFADL